MNYKGYEISVTKHKGKKNGIQYLAAAINGSDSAFGETEEDAIRILKNKIDAIPAFQQIYTRPYSEAELEQLIQYIKNPDNELMIRLKLNKQHYIGQNDFSGIDLRAICNHSDVIETALNECGNSYCLKPFEVLMHGIRNEYILYDAYYYEDTLKFKRLLERLENTEA